MNPNGTTNNPRYQTGRILVFTYNGKQVSGIVLEVMPAFQFKDYTQIRLGFRQNKTQPSAFSTKAWMYLQELEHQSVLDIMAEQIVNNEVVNEPF